MINFLLNNVYSWIGFSLIISLILIAIPSLRFSSKINKKNSGRLEILSPFECGFNPFSKSYMGFCIQFLNVAILFLLVDLEIALILPLFLNFSFLEKIINTSIYYIRLIGVFLILLLILEYFLGGLNWKEDL